MARKYYTLCERTPGQLWAPQFGDYSKAVVVQERADMKDSGSFIKGTEFTIITTSGSQQMISEAVAQLNADPKLQAKLLKENDKKLDPKQLAMMASILGVSNAGSDHLFVGHHVQWTVDAVRNYMRNARQHTVDSITTTLVSGLAENDEMLEMFLEEARSWVKRLKGMKVSQVKATWSRYADYVDCMET